MSLNEPRDATSSPTPSTAEAGSIVSRESDSSTPRSVDPGRLVAGVVFIVFGLCLWLTVRGTIDIVDLTTYWPLFLIASGGAKLIEHGRDANCGWVPIAIGVGFLVFNLGYAPWPILLVAAGVVVLIRGLGEGRGRRAEEN